MTTKTHAQKILIIKLIIIIIKRQYQPLTPRKKHPYNTPDGGPHVNSQGIGAIKTFKDVENVAKTSTLEVAEILDPLHFYVSAT